MLSRTCIPVYKGGWNGAMNSVVKDSSTSIEVRVKYNVILDLPNLGDNYTSEHREAIGEAVKDSRVVEVPSPGFLVFKAHASDMMIVNGLRNVVSALSKKIPHIVDAIVIDPGMDIQFMSDEDLKKIGLKRFALGETTTRKPGRRVI